MMLWAAVGGWLLGCLGGNDLEELMKLRQAIRESRGGIIRLRTEAHAALDRGEYEKAAQSHRQSLRMEQELARLSQSEQAQVEKVAQAALLLLDDDAVEARDRGSAMLVALGPGAVTLLQRLVPPASVEAERRLEDAISRLGRLEIDSEGRFHQWAKSARASSEYTHESWSAMQATGKPDTFVAGDAPTAWASLQADAGIEWLELTYEVPVHPSLVRVHETFNPGAVVRLEVLDREGAWKTVWEGKDPTRECPGWLDLPLKPLPFGVRTIRVVLDTASVPGWNEIDAVELVGDPLLAVPGPQAERAQDPPALPSRR